MAEPTHDPHRLAPQTPTPAEPPEGASQDAIVADLEETRERLGDTVDALRAKADVTGNAKRAVSTTVDDTKQRARDTWARVLGSDVVRRARSEPAVPAGVGAAVLLAVVVMVVRRRHAAGGPRLEVRRRVVAR